ncbi:hypothetical protein BC830DRAFT_626411 [Chytriomyces sp. MP71]|nr:hypothetical protein BC830DRAFT_626411 [Chytriomyces sp. MP71]
MLARQQTLPAKLASSPPQSPFQPNYRIAARPPSPLKWARKDPDSRAASPTSSLSVTPHSDLIPMKTQVNDRAVRKIMDLEIANESLLAVNTTLENTIREQALNMEQMRRMVGMMKRKLGVTDLDLSASASDAFDVSTEYSLSEDVLSASEFSSPSGGIIKKQFLDNDWPEARADRSSDKVDNINSPLHIPLWKNHTPTLWIRRKSKFSTTEFVLRLHN